MAGSVVLILHVLTPLNNPVCPRRFFARKHELRQPAVERDMHIANFDAVPDGNGHGS